MTLSDGERKLIVRLVGATDGLDEGQSAVILGEIVSHVLERDAQASESPAPDQLPWRPGVGDMVRLTNDIAAAAYKVVAVAPGGLSYTLEYDGVTQDGYFDLASLAPAKPNYPDDTAMLDWLDRAAVVPSGPGPVRVVGLDLHGGGFRYLRDAIRHAMRRENARFSRGAD